MQLDKPLPWFSNLTASFAFYPVQKANVDSGANWTRPGSLVGNGAYVLKDRVVNEKLVVVPNTHYWDNAKTVIQQVTFVPINQESAATKRYLAGDIDITESFPKKYVPETAEGYSGGRCIPRRSWVPTITLSIPKRGRRRMSGYAWR